jgi:hypothetical protein
LSGERQRHARGGFLILQERDASDGPHGEPLRTARIPCATIVLHNALFARAALLLAVRHPRLYLCGSSGVWRYAPKRCSRQRAIPGFPVGIIVSRPKKKLVLCSSMTKSFKAQDCLLRRSSASDSDRLVGINWFLSRLLTSVRRTMRPWSYFSVVSPFAPRRVAGPSPTAQAHADKGYD